MSNLIVSKGLGGGQLLAEGWGGAGVPVGSPVISISGGGLTIRIAKSGSVVVLTYNDGSNTVIRSLPATAAQVASTDWMLIRLTRSGSNLIIALDKNTPVTIPLATIVEFSGNMTLMDGVEGDLFDVRVKKKAISSDAFSYYFDDVYENAGESLIPKK